MKIHWLACLSLLGFIGCQSAPEAFYAIMKENPQVNWHLKGGKVLDGSGDTAFVADVLLRGDSILYVGEVDEAEMQVEHTLDVSGKLITPGFIDTHAHGDPLREPDFANFLAQGVTSIVLGQDGFSTPTLDWLGWIDSVNQVRPGVNILPFVGHGTLWQLSGPALRDKPIERHARMVHLLDSALQLGHWGMSTGLEYTPGRFAKEHELLDLARVVGRHGGLITSHIRNEDDEALENSLRELIRQGQHCRVQVSHLKSVYGKGTERAERILALLDSARQAGIPITADVYPYTASYTGIGIVFPSWAKYPNRYSRVRRLKQQQLAQFLRKKIAQRNGPEATLFGTDPYTGMNLAQVADSLNKPFERVLIEDIGPRGASAAYFVMDESLQARLIQDSLTMVCSDGSPTMQHPRGYGSFTKIIETYVLEKQLFSLPEAIRKMTSLPAQSMGLTDRGRIQAGMKADLIVFDPTQLHATATFEQPHQLATGMEFVWINGKLALERASLRPERCGKVLLKP